MTSDKDFQRRLELIERGIRQMESAADPSLRAAGQQVVQAILDLHGRGLERLLEIVHHSAGGPAAIDELGRDPLIGPLLILHSLHPFTLEARVLQALESVRPSLRSASADVELIGIRDGVVSVRVFGAAAQKAAVEQALVEAAPDAVRFDVEAGMDALVGFVPLNSLRSADAAARPPAMAATQGT